MKKLALAFVNHLLAAEGWALTRLKPFAGQRARIEVGPVSLCLIVAGDGSLQADQSGDEAQVCIRLPGDAPLRLLSDRRGILQSARIAGSADFAEALGFVARNLSWDAEADLARLVGDVPAHRLSRAAAALAGQQRLAVRRLTANFTEFIADEEHLLIRSQVVASFTANVDRLHDDVVRLEQRIGRL